MANYKVVLEIELEAESPLEAAKEIQSWLDEADNKWQYYVQKRDDNKVYSVDLEMDDEDAVLETLNYHPLIKA